MTPNPQVENHQDAQDHSSLRARRRAERGHRGLLEQRRLAVRGSSVRRGAVGCSSVRGPVGRGKSAGIRRHGTTIALADSSLGKILVDGKGMTLYMFTPGRGRGRPTCYDDCATNWPALVADGTPTAGTGLDATKLVVVDRTDGGKQVKFGEYPLYHFAADKAAGDANGQGVGDSGTSSAPTASRSRARNRSTDAGGAFPVGRRQPTQPCHCSFRGRPSACR